MTTITATYSPDDNKLRLYASTRLDRETYDRVRAAGFIWAPKQELFVAPMWTPSREDLARELAGEIDDEDVSLRDRAEERAERAQPPLPSTTKAPAESAEPASSVASCCPCRPSAKPVAKGALLSGTVKDAGSTTTVLLRAAPGRAAGSPIGKPPVCRGRIAVIT